MKKYHVYFVVLLLETWHSYSDFGWLGIRYIISELKKEPGITVSAKFIEYKNWKYQLQNLVKEEPDMVGLPALQPNLPFIQEFTSHLRKQSAKVKIVIGNSEATMRPDTLLENISAVDFAVIGEGEHTFRELAVKCMRGEPVDQCRGLCYRKAGKIYYTAPRLLEENLDAFAFPDRGVLPMHVHNKVYDIITSRGCYGNCSFCSNETFKMQPGKRVRVRSLKNVIDEIELLVKRYNCGYVSISDDTFGDPLVTNGFSYLDFHNALLQRKIHIRYRIQIRSENINEQTVQTLSLMRDNGLDNIFIGFETGNAEDMRLYGKIATLDQNKRAVRLLNQSQLPYSVGFIMFNPYSTLQGLRENLEFLKTCTSIMTPYTLCSKLLLFNGTALLKKACDDGLAHIQEPLSPEHTYRFQQPEIESVWKEFQRLNNLPVDFIFLDIINSNIKNLIANQRPLYAKPHIQSLVQEFFDYVYWLRESLFTFCDQILISHEKYEEEKNDQLFESILHTMEEKSAVLEDIIEMANG